MGTPQTSTFEGYGGVKLAATISGPPDGPAVMLAHGGGQTRHSWAGTGAKLAGEGFHVVAIDMRGHGDSDWADDGDYSPEAYSADLRAVVAAIGRPTTFVGASLGGSSSMMAIGEYHDQASIARALVLVDIAPRARPEGAKRVRDFMMGAPDGFGSLEEVADAIAAYNPHRPRPRDLEGLKKNVRQREDGRWIWHWDPRMMTRWGDDETRVLAYRDRVADAARRLAVPTLLVRGGDSDLIAPEDVDYFLELTPHAETVEVPGAGHMVAGDRNDIFTDAIMPFLRRHA